MATNFIIDKSKFDFIENNENEKTSDVQKKFTLKIQKTDFDFIKHLSHIDKTSINQIIEHFIFIEIANFLGSLPHDESIALINAADLINKNDGSKSFFYDVYGQDFQNGKYNYFNEGIIWEARPDTFKHICKILMKNNLFNYPMNGGPTKEEFND